MNILVCKDYPLILYLLYKNIFIPNLATVFKKILSIYHFFDFNIVFSLDGLKCNYNSSHDDILSKL